MLLEPPLIGDGEPRAAARRCLRDRPRNRALVGDADDESVFSCECHAGRVPTRRSASALAPGATGSGSAARALARPAAAARRAIPLTLALGSIGPGAVSRTARNGAVTRSLAASLPRPWTRAAEAWTLSGRRPLPLAVPHGTMAAIARAVVARCVEPAAAAGRANGKVRGLALGRLSFRTRQRRPDQGPMHRPFVAIVVGSRLALRVGFGLARRHDGFGGDLGRLRLVERFGLVDW